MYSVGIDGFSELYAYSFFIAIGVFSASEHLNKNNKSYLFEWAKSLYGLVYLIYFKTWFGTISIQSVYSVFIITYLIGTSIGSYSLFSKNREKVDLGLR